MAYKDTDYESSDFSTEGVQMSLHIMRMKWITGRVEVRRNGNIIATRKGRVPFHIPEPVEVTVV